MNNQSSNNVVAMFHNQYQYTIVETNQINDESEYVEPQQTRQSTKISISPVTVCDLKHPRAQIGNY